MVKEATFFSVGEIHKCIEAGQEWNRDSSISTVHTSQMKVQDPNPNPNPNFTDEGARHFEAKYKPHPSLTLALP